MTEHIYWGTAESLTSIFQSLDCPPEALMMLERVPTIFLSDAEREDGICLRKYDAGFDFDAWERGRIFHDDFELRWEKESEQFTVVYIGKRANLPMPETNPLSGLETEDDAYYLWGEKMTADLLNRIGQPETANLFLELQIPRLLRYPVSNRNERFRVKLFVRHYLNPETGTLEFYRFLRAQR